jgi:putative endonuclease
VHRAAVHLQPAPCTRPARCTLSPVSADPRHLLGKTGENLACAELRRRGYEIVARGHRTRHGEIDIIARDGETLVFVEVKARAAAEFGSGAEAVTAWKQRRLASLAEAYLVDRRIQDVPCRFDVVTVDDQPGRAPVVEVIPNAFDADGW